MEWTRSFSSINYMKSHSSQRTSPELGLWVRVDMSTAPNSNAVFPASAVSPCGCQVRACPHDPGLVVWLPEAV